MRAKYRVLAQVKKMLQEQEMVTTQEVASAMKLSRGVVSLYLSQLYQENLLQKRGTKPVYWLDLPKNSTFSDLIGANGSLKKVVKECKAAVNYPPNGFPIIITGPSGSGKSYLASLIFRYAQEVGVISSNANFVALNCADYADNPELLSAVLFGYKKGAFTGADEDRTGLIDQANNGYLFLDEVHRLPRESQEKLFILLDSGNFYPLGESEHVKHVNIRFLFATTEKIETNLLKTFRRRVPLQVTLPSWTSRPISEKCSLIEYFFQKESSRIDCSIRVSYGTITNLLNSQFIGNVGSLENKIKLMCAESYHRDKTFLTLNIGTDSDIEKGSWLIKSSQTKKILQCSSSFCQTLLSTLINTLRENEEQKHSLTDQSLTITQFLRDLQQNVAHLAVDEDYTNYLVRELKTTLKIVGAKYGFTSYLKDSKIKQASALIALMQENTTISELAAIDALIKRRYPRTIYLCKQVQQRLSFNISSTLVDIILLYTVFDDIAAHLEHQNLLGIMVCHGGRIASDICSIVNDICQNYIFEAFDMPLEVSNKQIVTQVNHYLKQQNRDYEGTILLFDMGSLSKLYQQVKPLLNNDLLVINNLTTSIALDLGMKIQHNESFKKIAAEAEKYPKTMNVQYYEGISPQANIIVSCMSGVGLSEEVKRILKKHLNTKIAIITMDYHDLKLALKSHENSYFANTKFILTTNDLPKQNSTEVLNIYNIMDRNGDRRLRLLLKSLGEKPETINNLLTSFLRFFTIGGIKGRLRFLNPDKVIPEIQGIVTKFENYYHLDLSNKFKLSLYMHIALMLERLMLKKDDASEIKSKAITSNEKEFYQVAKKIFHPIEVKYNITVNDYELSLIFELFKANSRYKNA